MPSRFLLKHPGSYGVYSEVLTCFAHSTFFTLRSGQIKAVKKPFWELPFKSGNGLNEVFATSSFEKSEPFATAFLEFQRLFKVKYTVFNVGS